MRVPVSTRLINDNPDSMGFLAEAETNEQQGNDPRYTGVCPNCSRPFAYGFCLCDPEPDNA